MITFPKLKEKQPLSAILKTSRSITITPISYKEDSDSRHDYEIEMDNYLNDLDVMWDDAPSNDTRKGDLFAFIQGQGRKETDVGEGYCQIRRVIGVYSNNARPSHWDIPAHQNRRVLALGDILFEGTWVELCKAAGRKDWGKVLADGTKCTCPRQGSKRWKLGSDPVGSPSN